MELPKKNDMREEDSTQDLFKEMKNVGRTSPTEYRDSLLLRNNIFTYLIDTPDCSNM